MPVRICHAFYEDGQSVHACIMGRLGDFFGSKAIVCVDRYVLTRKAYVACVRVIVLVVFKIQI